MSQLGEQTQEDSAEDLDEDSPEDTKEESNEDLNEDSEEEEDDPGEALYLDKPREQSGEGIDLDDESDENSEEDSKEDSAENLNEDLEEEKEDSAENLNEATEEEKEDTDEDLNEASEEEKEDTDEDLNEASEEEKEDTDEDLNEASEEEKEDLDEELRLELRLEIKLELKLNVGISDQDLSTIEPDTKEGISALDLSIIEPETKEGISALDLSTIEPETKEGISALDLSTIEPDIKEGISALDLSTIEPDTKEGISALDLSTIEPDANEGISALDLSTLDSDKELKLELRLELELNVGKSASDLSALELKDECFELIEGLNTEDPEKATGLILTDNALKLYNDQETGQNYSDLNMLDSDTEEGTYVDNNEGTTTCLLIKQQEESNELASEPQEDTAIKNTLENELVNELQEDTSLQDTLENELAAQDALEDELPSELQDDSTLQDELSELDGNLSELEDISSSELREYTFIQDVLEDELSELDGELSELKDISSSGLQEDSDIQDVLEDEIGDDLTHLEEESWDLKDMFLNEYVDLSDTQYSLEEDSLEISNAMEPMALDIANVHTGTFGQDYIGEPQIENVYEEGDENEINYDLSIDKSNQEASEQELSLIGKESGEERKEITDTISSTASTDQKENQEDTKEEEQASEEEKEKQTETDYNRTGFTDQTLNLKQRLNREFGGYIDQRKNLDEWLRREFVGQVDDKEQDIQKDEPEQELSVIGKENKEENKEITATTSSRTSTEQKDNQEDANESEPTSERNEKSYNNEDTKDSEKDSENLNKETEEEVKLEGEELEDLEDLIDKATEEFKIFKDPKLKEMIKNYDGVAYKGNHFTMRFIKFIIDQDNDALTKKEKDNLVKRIDEFNENKNINNLLKYYIRYTKLSQPKILKNFKDMNLKISIYTLTKISHKILTREEYKKRFPRPEDWVSDEQREGIIKAGRSEDPDSIYKIAETWGVGYGTARDIIMEDLEEKVYHKKFHRGILDEQREGIIKAGRSEDPDSIKDIAETWGVAYGTARDIIMEDLEEKIYHKKFPKPPEVSNEQREGIIKAGHSKNPGSLKDIAETWGVGHTTAGEIIKKELEEKVYHKKFPKPPEVSDEQREGIIKAGRSENPGSLDDIGDKFGVSGSTAGKIIKKDLGKEEFHKKFPPTKDWVSDKQREGIIKAGRSENPGSLDDIGDKFGVSGSTAGKIIKKDLGKEEFHKKFHNDIPQLIGFENHKLIEKIATQDFDEKRKKSPDVPILISEPPIYVNSQKCCDNAFKNNKKYLQKLLKDRIAKELKIDPKKLDHIKVVLFDYTSWLHKANIMDKIEKYQHSKIMLFIVGTHWFQNWIGRVKRLPKDKRIKYPENIRIIKWDLFADLLNLSDDNRKRLKEIVKLSRLRDLETLIKLNEQNNYKLHRLKKSKTGKKGSKNNLDAFLSRIF